MTEPFRLEVWSYAPWRFGAVVQMWLARADNLPADLLRRCLKLNRNFLK